MYQHQLTTLKNGLKVITVPMKQVESMTLMIGVRAGSRYENLKTNGLSHFLEHMVFKGTPKRPTTLDISLALDGIGASFNAFTGKEFTGYFIKANAQHQSLAFDVLTDMVLNAKLDAKDIGRERGVIIEEINMYEDLPAQRVPELFESLLYSPTSLGWYVAGKKENIKSLKRNDFTTYLNRLYHPGNMVVVKSGKLENKECLQMVEKYFGNLKGKTKEDLNSLSFDQKEPKLLLKNKKTAQSHFCLGVRTYPYSHPDHYALKVLATILGGSMSSRLFIQVREKRGLAYYIRTFTESLLDNGYLMTQTGVDVNKIDEAIKVILDNYRQIASQKVLEKELKKAKELMKGRLILALEDSQNVALDYFEQYFYEDKIHDPEEKIKLIDQVSAQDIQRVAKDIFNSQNLNLAIIGPYKEESRFLRLLK